MQVHSPIRLAERCSAFAQGDRVWIDCCAQRARATNSDASLRMTEFGFLVEGCGDASGAQSCWGSVCGNSSGVMQVRSGEKFVMVPAGEMQVHSTRVQIDCCAEKRGATNSESSLRMTDLWFLV